MDKPEIEARLRAVVAAIPEGEEWDTRRVAAAVLGDAPESADLATVRKMGATFGLAERGPPQPGKAFMRGRTVHPLIWRRRSSTVPAAPAYAVPPSELRAGDVASSLAPTYTVRDAGSRGPASPTVSLTALAAKVERLEERIAALESLLVIR